MTRMQTKLLSIGCPADACDNPAIALALGTNPDSRSVAGIAAAFRLADEENWFPDIGIVCQDWPEQYATDEIRRLLETFPLTRWICACGPWCDSEGRTGTRWPPAIRVPQSQLGERLERELGIVVGREPPLPLTAARDEVFEFDYRRPDSSSVADAASLRSDSKSPTAAVISPDDPLAEMLRAQLAVRGHRLVTWPGEEVPGAILWDADPWDAAAAERLVEIRRQAPQSHIVALVGFERPELTRALRTSGADEVVWKLAPAWQPTR